MSEPVGRAVAVEACPAPPRERVEDAHSASQRREGRPLPSAARWSRAGLTVALFAALTAGLVSFAWTLVEWQTVGRRADLIQIATTEARRSVSVVAANLSQVLSRHDGIASVLAETTEVKAALASFGWDAVASTLPMDARIAAWTRRPDLLALDRRFHFAAESLGVDALWLMNAGGDCVAASSYGGDLNFVGTNYADRAYFTRARAGLHGRQFAVGRVKKAPALFYSAPVQSDGRSVGVMAVRTDLPTIATAVNRAGTFIADDDGVIILAADPALEMRTLPHATVLELPEDVRSARYRRIAFETLDIDGEPDSGGLARTSGSPFPHVWERRAVPEHGVTVHAFVPVRGLESLRTDARVAKLLLSGSGVIVLLLAFGGVAYFRRERRNRASMAAANQKLSELNESLERIAKTDALTGCYNRRQFRERLGTEIVRAGRYERPLSVISLDIDFFKLINDSFGHAAGDLALQHVTRTIRRQLRAHDELGRLGGEEFSVLVPETGLEGARVVAERIRTALKASPVPHQNAPIALSASFGVATMKSKAETIDTLLQRADKALYDAKANGRDRIALAE